MNLSILPKEAQLDLKKYYDFLVWKYKSLSKSIHDKHPKNATEMQIKNVIQSPTGLMEIKILLNGAYNKTSR
ncbi:hypothetical protein MHK_004789, partial [Candidatus Magnetomorum sp. HK-1]